MLGEKSTRNISGFTLVEMAIVLAIIGLAGFAIVNAYTTLRVKTQKSLTSVHLNLIQDALGAYAERNFRLPCPLRANYAVAALEPYGYEAGSGVNGGTIPANCPTLEGMVPFKTLGLSEDIIKDGYGFPFTYRMGRSTSRDPSLAVNIHESCRGTLWTQTQQDGTQININPLLARFCCRDIDVGANDELDIQFRPAIAAATQNMYPWGVDSGAARYGTVDTMIAAFADNAANRNTIRPVYVLVSHGSNGIGSFDLMGSGTRIPGFLGLDETQNRTTASSQYIEKEWVLQESTNNFFDDTVVWGTQESLLARGGEYSCYAPKR